MSDSPIRNDQAPSPAVDISLWRTLDAAANRAAEGLRVIEDLIRYGHNDGLLSGELKSLRHQLDSTLRQFDPRRRLEARDTPGDVGAGVTGPMNTARADWADLVTANSKRLQQALRSLEEHAKLVAPEISGQLESLRYRAYTLEKMVFTTLGAQEDISPVAVYVLIDGQADEAAFGHLVQQVVDAQADFIQLRDKALDDRTLAARAHKLRQWTRGTATRMILNDRADLALISQADGVHVGQEELSVHQVRSVVGVGKLVGVSTHTIDQARQAVRDGANYIGVGPTFPSRTKQFDQFAGLDFVREVAQEITLPAFAIGGIDLENIDQVVASGLRRVAVAGCVTSAPNPGQVVRQLRQRLEA